MPLTEPQKRIFDDPARFRVAVCGRRFGKSFLAIWELARAARFPGQRVLYIAPSYRQAKSIIFDPLVEQLSKRKWIRKINQSELTITLINGSSIELRSADAADSMRGISGSFAVLDEFAFFEKGKSVWTDVVRPLLSDQEGGCLFITTPQGQGNWSYDLFLQAQTTEGWSAYQYRTIDGGQVSEEEVEAAKRDLDESTFAQEYLADFTATTRNILSSFDMRENVKPFDGEINKIWIGADFNIDPVTAVVGTPVDGGFHIFDEIAMYNSNTNELAEEIIRRYGTACTVFPDPAGSARKTSARGRSDHYIQREHGLMVRAPRAHSPVKDRNATVNMLFKNAAGLRRLFIDPSCKKLIESVNKYSYKAGTMQPDKGEYDHLCDALGYVIDFNFNIKTRDDTRFKPKSYGI